MHDRRTDDKDTCREKATVHIQTKLTVSEYAPFKIIIETTGIKKSELFRKILMASNAAVVFPDNHIQNNMNILSGVNQAIYQLNQIAERLESIQKHSQISERYFLQMMNALISLEKQLIACLKQC